MDSGSRVITVSYRAETLLVALALCFSSGCAESEEASAARNQNSDTTRVRIGELENALKMYAIDHSGSYPEGTQDVSQLLSNPTDTDGYPIEPYLEELPRDAWGEPLYYEYPNTRVPDSNKPAIWSAGKNRRDEKGEGDDINNWSDVGD